MKLKKLFITFAVILTGTGVLGQRINRGDICAEIPGLTLEQQKKIDGLSASHKEKMDQLRSRFYAERNSSRASALKTKMNTEMKNHIRNISAELNSKQQAWFTQHCSAGGTGSYYFKGNSQRMGRNGGKGLGRGNCVRADPGAGRGYGNGTGRGVVGRTGRGAGQGAGQGMGPCSVF